MKPWRVSAGLLVALWSSTACASGTLDFEAGGYSIEMEVGDDTAPVVSRVRFFAPGDRTGIALRAQDVHLEAFDVDRRQLRLHHAAGGGVPAFDLRMDGDRGVLDIGGQHLAAPFDWQL